MECSSGDVFFPEREVKKAREIRLIREAVLATEEIMKQFRQILVDSKVNAKGFLEYSGKVLTSEFLRSELESEFKRMGYSASQAIFAHGSQAAETHNAGSGQLFANTPIVMDIFPRNPESGYWGDLTRTVVKGNAPAIVKRAYEAVKAARDTLKSEIAIGKSCSKLHILAEKILDQHRFFTVVFIGF